VSAMNNTTQLL